MTTPPDAPVPEGYRPGDYVPFKDRDPSNPSAIAGQWVDPASEAQRSGRSLEGGTRLTHEDRYRAIYGDDAPSRVTLASWGRRVPAYLVDTLLGTASCIPFVIGYLKLVSELRTTTDQYGNQVVNADVSPSTFALLGLGLVTYTAFWVWNAVVRQGRTGYSLGKTVVGIRLVGVTTLQPVGPSMSLLRQLAHVVDSMVCYLGWLWPLWDARKQTLGDKIVGTVVVVQPQDPSPR